ncbi:UbiE/COQ5 family methyltransferase (macronuclear) [Tetrahymena thermophila SB210]|uniref:UbiE/COQ5 family methyltransferase n=1 Tax=Tetrahymena thermophila (strain SB210) TaxID=312017 RepID=I7MDV1_TETTS|nr:UbiE/COQ5 family methyltransferase [Tetrahymena thermophila SB210]EAR91003.1 UbiE/COQ5 family methyltransferase [Tetrahymena thermophila SB210]|eukprot:XP_001011248.1 UbiE/COQ5 family methyltransferase [Tetrahymena thermophila SB210]
MSKTSNITNQCNKPFQIEYNDEWTYCTSSHKSQLNEEDKHHKKLKLPKDKIKNSEQQNLKQKTSAISQNTKNSQDCQINQFKQQINAEPNSKHDATQNKSKKEKKNKVIYVRKNPQPVQCDIPQLQNCQQQDENIQKCLEEQDEQQKILEIMSQIQKLVETEYSKVESSQQDNQQISALNTDKIESLSANEENTRLEADVSERISTESRKKSESNNEPVGNVEFNIFLQDREQKLLQDQPSQVKQQKGANLFYTPQKKLNKKTDVQQYYYQQFSKRGLYSAHHRRNDEEEGSLNRHFTQSPGFTRQKENQEDIKVRRQEDRLKMLTSVLSPQIANINGYLDMGCGNCEITAQIGKVYGAKYIVGCDIYSEDQFVRPADTPSNIQFTYIANKKDSLQPVQDKSLNLITCFMVLHHIENLDTNLKELQRVIIDGGYLYIREHDVPQENIELDKYLRYKHERFDDCGQYMKFWGKNELRNKLSQFGFIHKSDSLYEDDRPNRQKVYHSLFQFSSEHLKQVNEQLISVQISEGHQQNQQNTEQQQPTIISQINLSSNDKKYSKNSETDYNYENNIKEIKVKIFEIENEDYEINSLSQSSTESEKLQEQICLSQKSTQDSVLNKSNNNLFQKKFSTSPLASNSVTTSSLDQESNRANSYNKDEIKENSSFYNNRKESPLIWRNQIKNQQEQLNDQHSKNWADKYESHKYNKYKQQSSNFQGNKHQTHYYKSYQYDNQQNDQKRNAQEFQNKNSQNPNFKFKKFQNDFQNSHKKHKESYDFEFEDDDEEFNDSFKRKKEQTRTTQNNNKSLSDKKNHKQVIKQTKPVQLIDILS